MSSIRSMMRPEKSHQPCVRGGLYGLHKHQPIRRAHLKKRIPSFIAPAYPVLRPTPPSGPQWRHEVKFDGWRVQARKNDTKVVLLSRLGNDISHRAPDVVRELARMPTRTFLLDGELVAVAQNGRPWFEATGLARQRHCLCAFDLLWLM